ncbi:MAG: MurR/RpiR family transcriptional regulator [Clostridia bacterium]|nr:MurR/RpiR family transcriptional regulator [Clostridia bacterium]
MEKLFFEIKKNYAGYSKGQKRIADYITSHYDKAAFMTAAKLGEKTDVSESTVVRFAAELGFSKYANLQHELQNIVRNKLTSVERMAVTNDRLGSDDVITNVLERDIAMIKSTMDSVSHSDFNNAVAAIKNAKRIYIIGVRSAASLASFLAFYFNMVFEDVKLVSPSGSSEIFESIYHIGKGDVCIAISFPRYSNRTVSAVRFISSRGAKIISITDNELAPSAKYADYLLLARSDMASFGDSLVAPLSLINALIVASTRDLSEDAQKGFKELEQIWQDYKVYEDDEKK